MNEAPTILAFDPAVIAQRNWRERKVLFQPNGGSPFRNVKPADPEIRKAMRKAFKKFKRTGSL